jgi:hypothetical protein
MPTLPSSVAAVLRRQSVNNVMPTDLSTFLSKRRTLVSVLGIASRAAPLDQPARHNLREAIHMRSEPRFTLLPGPVTHPNRPSAAASPTK